MTDRGISYIIKSPSHPGKTIVGWHSDPVLVMECLQNVGLKDAELIKTKPTMKLRANALHFAKLFHTPPYQPLIIEKGKFPHITNHNMIRSSL